MSIKQRLLLQSLPAIFILALVVNRQLKQRIHKVRNPVKDKLLRPAGESLRVKLEEMEEHTSTVLAITFVIPVAAVPLFQNYHWSVAALIVAVFCAPLSLKLFKQWNKISNYRLGFQGERAVAEELNQLMRKGCFVFHDLLMSEKANIDHVVVAPSGLFVIETKARRKRRARADREDYKIIYDGKALHFPDGTNTYGLAQADRNADWLSDQLSKALAEPIRVVPILTFPGWFIERTGRSRVHVVSHKHIAQIIDSNLGSPINEKQMKQITAWLEDRCRNVEF